MALHPRKSVIQCGVGSWLAAQLTLCAFPVLRPVASCRFHASEIIKAPKCPLKCLSPIGVNLLRPGPDRRLQLRGSDGFAPSSLTHMITSKALGPFHVRHHPFQLRGDQVQMIVHKPGRFFFLTFDHRRHNLLGRHHGLVQLK